MFGIMRCPCKNCIVDPTCKTSCKPFAEFIVPLDKRLDKLDEVFGKIDAKLEQDSNIETIFTFVGVHILSPIIYVFVKYTYGIKIKYDSEQLFDDRYTHWSNNKPS